MRPHVRRGLKHCVQLTLNVEAIFRYPPDGRVACVFKAATDDLTTQAYPKYYRTPISPLAPCAERRVPPCTACCVGGQAGKVRPQYERSRNRVSLSVVVEKGDSHPPVCPPRKQEGKTRCLYAHISLLKVDLRRSTEQHPPPSSVQ